MTDTISDLLGRINAATAPVALDAALLGDARLAWWLSEMLGCTATLSDVAVSEKGAGWFELHATIDGGPAATGLATITCFTSHLTDDPNDVPALELIMTFAGALPSRPASDYAATLSTNSDFLAALTIGQPQLVLSSYDFALAVDDAPVLASSLGDHAPSLPAGMPDPVEGIRFIADLALAKSGWADLLDDVGGAVWTSLSDAVAGAGRSTHGFIRFDDDSGDRWLEAIFDLSADNLSLGLPFTPLIAALTSLTVRSGLRAFGGRAPTLALGLRLTDGGDGDDGVDLVLEVPIGAGTASLSGTYDQPLPVARWLAALAGQADLPALLPAPFSALADAGIVALDATLALPALDEASVLVTLAPAANWVMVESPFRIEVAPWVEVGFVHSAGTGNTPVAVIGGEWILGATDEDPGAAFDLVVDVETTDVTMILRTGHALDAHALADAIHVPTPTSLMLVDLEMRGNIEDGTYSFLVDAHTEGGLKLPVFGAELVLTGIEIQGEHDPSRTDWRIAGMLSIGSAHAEVELRGATDEEFEFDVTIDNVAIGEIVDDLLGGIDLPRTLTDFAIADVELSYRANTSFTLAGGPATPLELIEGFSLTVDRFAVTRSMVEKRTSLDTLDLTLVLGSGPDAVTVTMAHSATQVAAGTQSVFEGKVASGRIALVELADALLEMVGLNLPLPRDLLYVESVGCRYTVDPVGEAFSIACAVTHGEAPGTKLGHVTFVASRGAPAEDGRPAAWEYLGYVQVDIGLGFHDLPVVGPALGDSAPEVETADIVILSADCAAEVFQAMLDHAPADAVKPPPSDAAHTRGASLGFEVEVQGKRVAPVVSLSGVVGPKVPRAAPDQPAASTPAMPADDQTSWFDVGKQLGPLRVDRVGLRYQSGRLGVLFDAGMALGPVGVGLSGLGLSSPLGAIDLSASLDGLSIAFATAGVTVAGGLIKRGGNYAGEVHLSGAELTLVAVGSYSTSPEGLFVFGLLRDPSIGGPPEFYVQGIAAGMGFNDRLKLPTVPADVAEFSLVQAAMSNAAPFGGSSSLEEILGRIDRDTVAAAGETWLAAGVQFTSFELVHSFALLAVEFGNGSASIGLVGLSRAALPPDASDPVALFEVALVASFDPAVGVLKVDGALTPRSYALSRDAHLTGGFGFYAWFKDGDGVDAGDFVYTMGGYHPRFAVPAHYPRPARLSLSWQPSDELSVKGSSYFALTPQCLMAGWSMQARWNSGPVSAWFDADADFLVYWKPFHYIAHIDTSLGASVTLDLWLTTITISVHVGIALDLAGPPFGGSADVDLDVISFTINFGADSNPAGFLDFKTFRLNFLPKGSVLSFQPISGLITDLTKTRSGLDTAQWILSPDLAVLRVSTALPARDAAFAEAGAAATPKAPPLKLDGTWNKKFSVAPMGPDGGKLGSVLTIILERDGDEWYAYPAFHPVAVLRSGPASLWGAVREARPSTPNQDALIDDLLLAIDLMPLAQPPDSTDPVDLENLKYDHGFGDMPAPFGAMPPIIPYATPVQKDVVLTYDLPGRSGVQCHDHILSTIADGADRRQAIVRAMQRAGLLDATFTADGAIDLALFATGTVLDDWPRIRALGESA